MEAQTKEKHFESLPILQRKEIRYHGGGSENERLRENETGTDINLWTRNKYG